jgi:hypothetical protein
LVTSANFTEAAHQRNIEAGILVESAAFTTAPRHQVEALIEQRIVRRLPIE